MEVIVTIIPIFIIIILGWIVRRRGFVTAEFLDPANRLIFYLSLPAMVFNSIARTKFQEQFDGRVLILALTAQALVYLAAFGVTRIARMVPERAGTFIQSSGHGNLGYFGLPIAFYYLDGQGLARAAILCGFLMILQNLLSVLALQLHDRSGRQSHSPSVLLGKITGNPVIIGAMGGIAVSALGIPVPNVIGRTLDILGALAPSLALLLIGASLSTRMMHSYFGMTLGALLLKLIFLPGCAVLLFISFGLHPADFLPAIILLSSPTATIVYVMAREMHGDGEFAVAAITASTLFAAATFTLWLALVAHLAR